MDDTHEILESIRRRVEHEDNLVNQRLSWILTSQAFLLTGYAILLNAPLDLRAKNYARHHELLMKIDSINRHRHGPPHLACDFRRTHCHGRCSEHMQSLIRATTQATFKAA